MTCGPPAIMRSALKQLAAEVADTLFIVMRVYFENPARASAERLINDPYMDDSFRIEDGLHMARSLLLELMEMGVPAGTEALDPISPQYLSISFPGTPLAPGRQSPRLTARWRGGLSASCRVQK